MDSHCPSDWCLCSRCPSTIHTLSVSDHLSISVLHLPPFIFHGVFSSPLTLNCLTISLSLSPYWFGPSYSEGILYLWSVSFRKVRWDGGKVEKGEFVYKWLTAVKHCVLSSSQTVPSEWNKSNLRWRENPFLKCFYLQRKMCYPCS